ncbi:DUF625-domain-containing protein [Fistulina hepatica ATCC 64428]|uniref:DUF625-domain-containing protein n=1 Tax=Fistulina hepatica ATCC 64428 TaxID=1128425 RepID=A0A0D7A1T4_9AGAR|nr:DUF625-domain-containing protein [Fistulina hepatica ATCC 64428]
MSAADSKELSSQDHIARHDAELDLHDHSSLLLDAAAPAASDQLHQLTVETDFSKESDETHAVGAQHDGTVAGDVQTHPSGEYVPDTVSPSELGSELGDIPEEPLDDEHTIRRVKVYQLIGSNWVDKGTAFCFGEVQDNGEPRVLARAERDYDEVILTTTIRSNDVYQRQQDTLIVWTEPDGMDYALSFQDPDGCSEIWTFIIEVQRHLSGEEAMATGDSRGPPGSTDDTAMASSSPAAYANDSFVTAVVRSGRLPTPALGNAGDIERAIRAMARTQASKERLSEQILRTGYVQQLIDVMHTAEDLEQLDDLHAICSLMQTILVLADPNLYEHILQDDIFLGVMGILEYDADFLTFKANYREFLADTAQFHQPVQFRDPSIARKIHQTYRLQFLKDVVLTRVIDDSTVNVLSSCIIFNQIDIITYVQQDPHFLNDIAELFLGRGVPVAVSSGNDTAMDVDSPSQGPPAPPDAREQQRRKEQVVFLLQQLCTMGKAVQLAARIALFRSLVDRGMLLIVQWALEEDERPKETEEEKCMARRVVSVGGEILWTLIDHDLSGVRAHVMKQCNTLEKTAQLDPTSRKLLFRETILDLACRIMAHTTDMGAQSQVGEALKAWLDLPNNDSPPQISPEAQMLTARMRKDDPGTERFMEFFYKSPAHSLFKPFQDLPDWHDVQGAELPLSRAQTNRYLYLCDLLHSFTMQHSFRSLFFIMSTKIIGKIPSLLKARDKHLRHGVIRFFKLLIKQNNSNMLLQIRSHDVLKPILDLTLHESKRDSLLSCSCQELFELVKRDNVKDIISYCMEKHGDIIRELAKSPIGAERFQSFIMRWEINLEPPPSPETKLVKPETRLWSAAGRGMDTQEEDYFNADDEDEIIPSISHQRAGRGPQGIKRKRRSGMNMGSTSGPVKLFPPRLTASPSLRTAGLGSLSDYGDDDDEIPTSPQEQPSPQHQQAKSEGLPTTPKITHRQIRPLSGSPTVSGAPGLPLMPRRTPTAEDDDDTLEAIARLRSRPESPAPGLMSSATSFGPIKLKRRREEDEDEPMQRLSKVKRTEVHRAEGSPAPDGLGLRVRSPSPSSNARSPSPRLQPPAGGAGVSSSRSGKQGDDPPVKKIQVKLGALGQAVANAPASAGSTTSPSSALSSTEPPENSSKNGDTG